MDTTTTAGLSMAGIGLLVARIVLGLLMAAPAPRSSSAGSAATDSRTPASSSSNSGSAGALFATAASISEVTSGLLLALGFLGRWARRS